MHTSDKNFDPLAARLEQNVYKSEKGKVRLEMLKHDMMTGIEELGHAIPLSILDAGGGTGKIARWLAAMGHNVTLCDISQEMILAAEEENLKAGLQTKIRLVHSPLQDFSKLFPGEKFDIILLHGVIEWMETPASAIDCLKQHLRPQGILSVLFYNRHKLVMKWGINGQFDQAFSGKPCNSRKLTPSHPLTTDDLTETISRNGLKVVQKAGIRIFYGFLARMVKLREVDQSTIDLEKMYYRQEPFASMGEHTHLLIRQNLSKTDTAQ